MGIPMAAIKLMDDRSMMSHEIGLLIGIFEYRSKIEVVAVSITLLKGVRWKSTN